MASCDCDINLLHAEVSCIINIAWRWTFFPISPVLATFWNAKRPIFFSIFQLPIFAKPYLSKSDIAKDQYVFSETRISILVTDSLLIQESKPGTRDCQSNNSQSRRRIYFLSWQPQTVGNIQNGRGARIHFCIFSPLKSKLPPKNLIFYC